MTGWHKMARDEVGDPRQVSQTERRSLLFWAAHLLIASIGLATVMACGTASGQQSSTEGFPKQYKRVHQDALKQIIRGDVASAVRQLQKMLQRLPADALPYGSVNLVTEPRVTLVSAIPWPVSNVRSGSRQDFPRFTVSAETLGEFRYLS